jgi:GTP cyclohydrolase II
MSAVGKVSALFGSKGQTGVNRGVAEFHARRPVLVTGLGETLLALPVEGLDASRLAEFIALCAPTRPQLVVTARRAHALGLDANAPTSALLRFWRWSPMRKSIGRLKANPSATPLLPPSNW